MPKVARIAEDGFDDGLQVFNELWEAFGLTFAARRLFD